MGKVPLSVKLDINIFCPNFFYLFLIAIKAFFTVTLSKRVVLRGVLGILNVSLLSNRKKFGWLTFAVNLFTYFCFITPLTALAVYARGEKESLCPNTTDIKEEVLVQLL